MGDESEKSLIIMMKAKLRFAILTDDEKTSLLDKPPKLKPESGKPAMDADYTTSILKPGDEPVA